MLKNRFDIEEYKLLYKYVCRSNLTDVLDVLVNYNSLDMIDDELFNIAVENKNTLIVEAMLDYFERNQLSKYADNSIEFLQLKNKMQAILEIAIEDVEISKEMEKVISSYISLINDSDESEQDLSGLEISSLNTSDEEDFQNGAYTSCLTEANLTLLNDFINNHHSDYDVYNTPMIG